MVWLFLQLNTRRHQTRLSWTVFDFWTLFDPSSLLSSSFNFHFLQVIFLFSHNLCQSGLFQKASAISHILGMDSSWNQAHEDGFVPFFVPLKSLRAQSEPRSQLSTMSTPTVRQNEVRKCTAKDLDAHRPEITSLYENDTLLNVRRVMRDKYGLDAT